ncbi:MAG: ATP-dependent sacrificial sulfur transferase LarE [Nitrospirae bacterium]|nr:ATP-dependent sacrificial sulfur transferase LarE [Nitrospirota bacterium]
MEILRETGGCVVAFSGGVDSAVVTAVAREVLGDRVLAVTGDSESLPARERGDAVRVAAFTGVRHRFIRTKELFDARYASNPANRCFYCKDELYARLFEIAGDEGLAAVVDGQNADDASDYRPGSEAARRHAVRSPLKEAGLSKAEVREIARARGIPIWDKPASPCLASRFPYGTPITADMLARADTAEIFVRSLGFRDVRVRVRGGSATVEVEPGSVARLLDPALVSRVVEALQGMGFADVRIDPEGFRSGKMNDDVANGEWVNR